MHQEPFLRTFRPERSGIRKILGDLEAEIMEYIWKGPAEQGVTVREVFEAISARRHIAYTTVMSTMTRLAKKQVLRVTTEQTAYQYFPSMTQDALLSHVAGRMMEDVLLHFSDALQGPDAEPDTLERARSLLEEITERRKQQGGGKA
jgi:predicted transcriptional regulator